MSTQKRMGKMSLGSFGLTGKQLEPTEPEKQAEPPVPVKVDKQPKPIRPLEDKSITSKGKDLVTVNIKITREQQDWLATTARQVRDNNITPVPPGERVYPQHLIGVAIELLQNSNIDWDQVRNTADLKNNLKL